MSKITIPFRDDMKELIISGVKTCTTRNKRYGCIGDTFEIDKRVFVLTWVSHVYLKQVFDTKYKEEGFVTPFEFALVWIQIHPRKGYDPNQSVWLHEFMEAK
jgi:hypothetical protein